MCLGFPLDVFFFSFRAAFMTYLQGALMGRTQVFYSDVLILIRGSCHVDLLLHVRNVLLFLWLVCLTWFRFTQVMPERNAEGVVFVFTERCDVLPKPGLHVAFCAAFMSFHFEQTHQGSPLRLVECPSYLFVLRYGYIGNHVGSRLLDYYSIRYKTYAPPPFAGRMVGPMERGRRGALLRYNWTRYLLYYGSA